MKKRIGKKVGFIVLFCLLAMNTVFADYTITYEVRVTKTVNAPKQNKDGTWDTADPNKKIRLDDGENPNDPKNYEGKGGIPTSTTSDTQTRIITIEGSNPPSDIEVQKKIKADIEKNAKEIEEANENSGATNNNKTTGLVTVNGTVTIQNNINKEVIREQKVSASAPIGDPVLLSSGQYLYTETDIDLLVSGLSFPITRYYQSGKNISATSMWFMSTDSRIVRGQKFQPEKELATLNALYEDSVANYNDTNKKYRDLKKWYTDQIALCKKELPVLKNEKNKINAVLKESLTASSRAKIENYIAKYNASISYYTNLQNNCNRELDKDKKNDPTGALVKIRAEIAKQEGLLNEQKAMIVQSEKELAHHNANVSYNSYAIRGSGFTDLIECGNDILKVYDERGVAFSYRIKEAPVYGAGENHYPRGSETEALFPGDENSLRLLKDGSFEWQKKDGSIWFYSAQGLLSRVQNANGVGIDFVYSSSYYLSSINYEGEVLYRFYYEGAKLVKIENARDPSEFVAYGYTGNLLSSVRDSDGDTVRFAYEGTLLKKIIKPDASFVSIAYDYEFDGQRYVSATTNEEGYTETFAYSKSGSTLNYTDHTGVRTQYWYDENHKTQKEVLSDGTTIIYAYDADGNLVSENRNGRVTTYAYDERGNKTQTKYADGSTEQWQYNALDKPLLYKDRDGVSLGYSYDEKGNLLSLSRGGKEIFSAIYNEKGLILSSVQASVSYAYSYDTYGNVIQRKTGTDGQERLEEWTYDAQNRVTSYINPFGEKTEYQYPTKSSTKILYPNGLETEILYNNRKDLVKLVQKDTTTGKIITKEFLYDKRHKLLEQRVNGVKTVSFSYKPAGEIESEIYWDAEGGWKKHYIYDEAARVKEVVQSKLDSNGAQVGAESYTTKFSYARNLAEEIITMTDPLNRALSQTRDEWNRVTKTKNALNEELSQSFSPQGRIKESQVSFGGKFSYDYDAQGYLTTMKEAEGEGEVRYTYNADGSIKTQTDSKGNLTSFFYNDFGELSEKQSVGKKEFFSYDSLGRLTLYIVGNNKNKMTAESWTEYAYANNGRTVKINYAGLVFQEQIRDAFGNTISVKDGMGNESHYFYNDLGQLICEENAYGNRTYYRYNALGKITHVWYPDVLVNAGGSASESPDLVALKLDPLKASLVYAYNFLGRVEKISDALGSSWEGSYDKGGRLISEKGRNLSETRYTYDALDRITEVRLAGLVSERYSYTNRGRDITFTDGNGNSYSYNKDLYGKLTSETNRLGDVQSYVYEKDGSLKNTKDFLSKIKTITMDEKNRRQTISYADGSKDIITYTMKGLIASVETSTGLIRYSYNQADYVYFFIREKINFDSFGLVIHKANQNYHV